VLGRGGRFHVCTVHDVTAAVAARLGVRRSASARDVDKQFSRRRVLVNPGLKSGVHPIFRGRSSKQHGVTDERHDGRRGRRSAGDRCAERFLPGLALLRFRAVDEVVPIVNRLASRFAKRRPHPGLASARSPVLCLRACGPQTIRNRDRRLWSPGAMARSLRAGNPGADFLSVTDNPACRTGAAQGIRRTIDSYSAFYENDRKTPPLVVICGSATSQGSSRRPRI